MWYGGLIPVLSLRRALSSTSASNRSMRRCVLRRQEESRSPMFQHRERPLSAFAFIPRRSYWIPRSDAPVLSKKRNSFLRLLKNKGFKEESMTQVGLYAIGTSATLESNKSLPRILC